ncbi:MAG: cytochrome o ubiquinol oxidase subunit III [Betaproteobacteria bacterium]|nr:cytochrome o ubiquinol oxidase subunit III [Betaproteobacteria bacterium]
MKSLSQDLGKNGNDYATEDTHEDLTLLGFWLYLMTDCLLFCALFATWAVLHNNTAGGPSAHDIIDLPYVLIETLCLLFSSTANGIAMMALQRRNTRSLLGWLGLTGILGVFFVAMELHEFLHLIESGNGPQRSGFLSSFFTLVGTHGLHVSIGLLWLLTLWVQISRKGLTAPIHSRLQRFSLFWHFLDLVWVAVFTFVYLIGGDL